MDIKLSNLISSYQKTVAHAASLLEKSGIHLPIDAEAWVLNEIPNKGYLIGNVPYLKHGIGCEVYLPSGYVDFDFGPAGEITGFDLWRLADFAEGHLQQYGFESVHELESVFKASIQADELHQSGNLYFISGHTG